MKTFFDGIFIDEKELRDDSKQYPMKLEYYKTIVSGENVEAKYGIEIVKTEFINGSVNVESNKFDNITSNVNEADKILTVLRNNKVTPIGMQDVLEELFANA